MGSSSPIRVLGLVALLALPAASPVGAQQEGLTRLRSAFPGESGARIADLIEAGRREGLPASLLVNKALEGAHKNASPQQVLDAVSAYARELREARAALGRDVSDDALKEAADALSRGIPPSTVRSLAGSARGEDLSILLVIMFGLMEEGVPAGPAQSLIQDAMRGGMSGDRMLSLPASVRGLIREGMTPIDAADSVRRGAAGGQAYLPRMRGGGPLAGRLPPAWPGARLPAGVDRP